MAEHPEVLGSAAAAPEVVPGGLVLSDLEVGTDSSDVSTVIPKDMGISAESW
jgi:hypothetical protein